MSFLRKKVPSKNTSIKKVSKPTPDSERALLILNALLGPILVDNPSLFVSKGCVDRADALSAWTWLLRDADAKLGEEALKAINAKDTLKAQSAVSTKIANLIHAGIEAAKENPAIARRLQIQLGSLETFEQLPHIETAFRHHQLLVKSVSFGKAINGVRDENSLKLALQTFPVEDPEITALMMHAALGQVQNPNRLVSVILDLSDGNTQAAVTQAGFASAIDAFIAHAQTQIEFFTDTHVRFTDVDLACRALQRYHHLIRSVSCITDGDKSSQWAFAVAGIVRRMSQLIEPRLEKVDADIRQSLRKSRSGVDRVDADLLFDALNGLYLLAAARESLDALALNAIVNRLWTDIGKSLEILISRNLEAYRQDPQNDVLAQRLNIGIKMAEIRFNPEYADIMARARDGAVRRAVV